MFRILATLAVLMGVASAARAQVSVPMTLRPSPVQGSAVIQEVTIPVPERADETVFFQNDRVKVCYRSCSNPQVVARRPNEVRGKSIELIPSSDSTLSPQSWRDVVTKEATTFYWANQFLNVAEREKWIRPTNGPLEIWIDVPKIPHFPLPHTDILAQYIRGDRKILFFEADVQNGVGSGALDPTVIVHEVAHDLLYTYEKDWANTDDLLALDEALSDYLSATFLSVQTVGGIALSQKANPHQFRRTTRSDLQAYLKARTDGPQAETVSFETHFLASVFMNASVDVNRARKVRATLRLVFAEAMSNPYVSRDSILYRLGVKDPMLAKWVRPLTNNRNEEKVDDEIPSRAALTGDISVYSYVQQSSEDASKITGIRSLSFMATMRNQIPSQTVRDAYWYQWSDSVVTKDQDVWVLYSPKRKLVFKVLNADASVSVLGLRTELEKVASLAGMARALGKIYEQTAQAGSTWVSELVSSSGNIPFSRTKAPLDSDGLVALEVRQALSREVPGLDMAKLSLLHLSMLSGVVVGYHVKFGDLYWEHLVGFRQASGSIGFLKN